VFSNVDSVTQTYASLTELTRVRSSDCRLKLNLATPSSTAIEDIGSACVRISAGLKATKEQHMISRLSSEISRRQLLATGSLTFAAACLAPRSLVAQDDNLVVHALHEAAGADITVQTLRRNISVLLGAGGNIAVLTGADGKLLIDAEIVTARPHVSAALASINADPIKQLINTHWHFDHTGGNEWLHQSGASILAHENTRKHLLKSTRVEEIWKYTFPAAPPGAIPSTVFKEDHTVHANDSTLVLRHYLPAHTDSDISVHFTQADIFHTGDTFWNRNYPYIDYSTGGSIDGAIRAAETNLAKITDKMIVIPGHGAVSSKADLVLFRDVLVEIRDKVAALKKQGRSLDEIVAAKPGARTDEEWGKSFISPSEFIDLVYKGV
jgi:glyoxylase-like metal-dependent hydrolase (beta-lactamase superfamily II)